MNNLGIGRQNYILLLRKHIQSELTVPSDLSETDLSGLCFTGLVPNYVTLEVQCCTGCATEQVYYAKKATHTELVM